MHSKFSINLLIPHSSMESNYLLLLEFDLKHIIALSTVI